MKRAGAILLNIYVSFASLSGQDVSISAVFDSSRIYIGDQINYTVTIEKPVSYILSVPVFRDTLVKNLEILQGPVSDTLILKDGRIRIKQKYLVTSFDSGFYQVPPVYAELRTNNNIRRFYSDYSPLEVMRVRITPPDTASPIFDIIGPYRAPLTLEEIFPWLIAVLAAAAAIWYAVRIYRKMKQKKAGPEPVINPDPAYIIAFRELENLKSEKLWQKGETKKYHTRLTEILRQYIENRFGVSSLELTTAETLDALSRSGFSDDQAFGKLRSVLTVADLVKFARHNPEASENELHFEYSWDFVSITRYAGESESDPAAEKQEGREES